ncbi:MAG: response regulator transcription factor [Lapillicoccus sp.]
MTPPAVDGPARVVIVDDDPLVRAGLTMILGGSPDLLVVAEADDGEQAQEVVARERPDVVLMDIRMPRRDGISATRGLVALPHAPRVIVLTTFDTDDQVLAALRAGASGFLLKDTPPPKIVEAIRRVLDGEPMLSPSVTAQLIAAATHEVATGRRDEALAQLAVLTEREHEVAVAIGSGRSNAEIAAELYMGVATVKAHVTRLFAKLGVENRVQVAMCVHDAGLV